MTKLCFFSAPESKPLAQAVRINQQVVMPLLATCISTLYLVWAISDWPQLLEAIPDVVQAETTENAVPTQARDYLQIADWRLMGATETTDEMHEAVLAPTPLQLKLIGTFYLPKQPKKNYAVIQSSDGLQQKYRVGETLPEGAVLQAVEKTRVVLKHNQRLAYLQFEANPLALTTSNDQSTL